MIYKINYYKNIYIYILYLLKINIKIKFKNLRGHGKI